MPVASLSGRLRSGTRSSHQGLDDMIMAAAPFAAIDRYARFVAMQWAFHRDIDALYDDARLNAWLPGLAARRRIERIAADLVDLQVEIPEFVPPPRFAPNAPLDPAAALGWLYVAEGSNLGASVLRKLATSIGLSDGFGARHLAPDGDGPAAHWRAFTVPLDAIALTDRQALQAIDGASAAFAHVRGLCDAAFA